MPPRHSSQGGSDPPSIWRKTDANTDKTENTNTKQKQMNRLSRYSFGTKNSNSNETQPKAKTVLTCTSFAASLAAAKGIAPFVFLADDEAGKYFAENIASLEIRVSEMDNGTIRNKAIATLKDGSVFNLRVYGTDKIALAEQVLDADAAKVLPYGYCKTSGEYVTADGINPALYVNVESLM